MFPVLLFIPIILFTSVLAMFQFGDYVQIYKKSILIMLSALIVKLFTVVMLSDYSNHLANLAPSEFVMMQIILLLEYGALTTWFTLRFRKIDQKEFNFLKIVIGLGLLTDIYFSIVLLQSL